ncbi:hypothetical protein ACSU64_04965 [Bacillaceae bacterium C204]
MSIAVTAKVIGYYKNDIAKRNKVAEQKGTYSIKTADSKVAV